MLMIWLIRKALAKPARISAGPYLSSVAKR